MWVEGGGEEVKIGDIVAIGLGILIPVPYPCIHPIPIISASH